MENETDEVVSGVTTLAMAVEASGPLSFADILDLGAEVAGSLADEHDEGRAHGHVGPGAIVRLEDGPWRLAPAALIAHVDAVPAPELGPDGEATPAADVYALGATLSFGLTATPVAPLDAASDAGPPLAEGDLDDVRDPVVDGDDGVPDPADRVDPAAPVDAADASDPADAGAGAPGTSADAAAGDADLGADELAPTAVHEAIDLTDDLDGSPMTLPEVMTSFLVALRASLAAEPAARPSASSLAATFRQLRSDAESALGGALVAGAAAGGVAAVTIGGAAAAEPWGAPSYDTGVVAPPPPPGAGADEPGSVAAAAVTVGAAGGALTVEGTGSAASLGAGGASTKTTKKSLKERAPVFVAVAAVLIAAVLGVSLVRERNDRTADVLAAGPTVGTQVRRTTTTTVAPAVLPVETIVETTTTLASTTTTSTSTTLPQVVETVPETTVPTTEAPTTTTPPTTAAPTTTTTAPTTTTQPAVNYKTVKVTCVSPANPGNSCSLFTDADASSAVRGAPLATGLNLQATCAKSGVAPPPGATDTWVYIIGPAPTYSGWLSVTQLGNSIPVLPGCPANQTP